ncbi:hypothetical protein QBZ16_002264 [Prototheca wickerhamii]|uniref:Uncharacterized protein n=1 Tax=Prototheca wickerhamii TaxID=3111 RepID=A0AAD9IMD5_PROWI|nr:hypothetical protein QBZ16_002264 [Prototheca wickerhamii]
MVDFAWLLSACPDIAKAQKIILDIEKAGLGAKTVVKIPPLPIPYGTHHRCVVKPNKAFVMKLRHGIRVAIHTANLIYPDCNNKSQAIYTQDFPPLAERASAHSQTAASTFQEDLSTYLDRLRLPAAATAKMWEDIRDHDFGAARVALIPSVPGYHSCTDSHAGVWGLQRLEQVLASERAFEPRFQHAPFLAQFSSLGSLDAAWVEEEFKGAACAGWCRPCEPGSKPQAMQRPTEFTQLVWPTVAEVQNSIEGWLAGRSIPGPHKNAAWGTLQKKKTQLMIRSYELGALSLPTLEANYLASPHHGYNAASGQSSQQPITGAGSGNAMCFGCLPPLPYGQDDTPWAVDVPWPGLDMWGCTIANPHGAFYGLTEDMEWGDIA